MKSPVKQKYTKQATSIADQINLLQKRGLSIENEELTTDKLKVISYYHLSGYLKSFQDKSEFFHKDTTFKNVIDLYSVDRKIKLLSFDAIERIEISLKTLMINTLGEKNGSLWYLDPLFFIDSFDHTGEMNRMKKEINRHKNKEGHFVKNFYQKYDEENLPSWIFFEILPFGAILKIFRNLKEGYRKKIATHYGEHEETLISWFVLLLDVRNICAHHERFLNRGVKDIVIPENTYLSRKGTVWNVFVVFAYFLRVLSPDSKIIETIISTIENAKINPSIFGAPRNWKQKLLEVFNEKKDAK